MSDIETLEAHELDHDDDESQLKLLIAKGKEQGFITYHEVTEHLPDEIVDPEQIEDIIDMITDMGIEVHEFPPDLDQLLQSNSTPPDDANASLVSVENEFGRTTDPVRMYMREMGAVDLLTRQGEIKIAKRIEAGMNQVLHALSLYPGTIDMLLEAYLCVQNRDLKLGDIILGFNIQDEYPDGGLPPKSKKQASRKNDDDDSDSDSDDALDLEEVRETITGLDALYKKLVGSIKRHGKGHDKTVAIQTDITEKFMRIRLAPKFITALTANVRRAIELIRGSEREVMRLCVKKANMPRKDFIASFPGNEKNTDWVGQQIETGSPYAEALAGVRDEVVKIQQRLADALSDNLLTIAEIKEVNKKIFSGEAEMRKAKQEMPKEKVHKLLKIANEPTSMETPIGDDDDSHPGDFIEDLNTQAPAEYASVEGLRQTMRESLNGLTSREAEVLRMRFGTEMNTDHTLEKVGKQFDVTRERIRQIEAKALRRLRHPSRSE